MTTHELIEKLTWALVEVTNQRPDMHKISTVLETSLGLAIQTKQAEANLKASLIRTAALSGEPMAAFQ